MDLADLEEVEEAVPDEEAQGGEATEPIEEVSPALSDPIEEASPFSHHEPAEEDDTLDPNYMAAKFGALIHMRSGRVHLCSTDAQREEVSFEKTMCGIQVFDRFELKIGINEFDLLCAKCFCLPTHSLPGRQAMHL